MIEIKRKPQMPAERAEMPLNGVLTQQAGEHMPDSKPALKRQQKPFKSIDGKRDYRAIYADVYKFHEQHHPPITGDAEAETAFWLTAAEEMTELANKYGNDALTNGLLIQVYAELEREYNFLRNNPHE